MTKVDTTPRTTACGETEHGTPQTIQRDQRPKRKVKPRELDIVIAEVPFTNCRGTKVRPFLVWRDFGLDYWGFPLTSHPPRGHFDIALEDWWLTNLNHHGAVRVASGRPIAKASVIQIIGTITENDASRINEKFAAIFATAEPQPAWKEELSLALA